MNQQRLRRLAYERDKGICALCKADCHKIKCVYWAILDFDAQGFYGEILGIKDKPHIFWEADHIVESADGGTDEIENIQTLCLRCHYAKSATSQAERRQRQVEVERAAQQAQRDAQVQNQRDAALAKTVLDISRQSVAVKNEPEARPMATKAELVEEFVNVYLQTRHANNPGRTARAMQPIESDEYADLWIHH